MRRRAAVASPRASSTSWVPSTNCYELEELPVGAAICDFRDHGEDRGDAYPAGDKQVVLRIDKREVVARTVGADAGSKSLVHVLRATGAVLLAENGNSPRAKLLWPAAQRVLANRAGWNLEVDVASRLPSGESTPLWVDEAEREDAVGFAGHLSDQKTVSASHLPSSRPSISNDN
jgi:hypothetical protein